MGVKCRIIRNPQTGKIENVEAPNGEQSQLYLDALAMTQNKEEALDLWATSYIDEFKEIYGNSENPLRLQDSVRFQQGAQLETQKAEIERRRQEEIKKSEAYLDPRGKHEDTHISDALSRHTSRNSGKLNGFSRRSLGVSKRLGRYDVDVIAEYEGNKEVDKSIKDVFPKFKGTQKIYEISNGGVYREMMIEALETNRFKSSVTVHSAEDYSNMRLFVTEDGSTGITLTKDGFLGGGFTNPKANRPNNLAQMMLLGIKEGAITAEAFDTVLPDYYSMFGFKAVSRTAFNEEYRLSKENGALEDWDYDLYSRFNNGRPDVVFFIYDGGDRGSIQNRIRQFDSYSNYQKHFTEQYDKDSYDDAYRFMEVEAINKNNYQNQKAASNNEQKSSESEINEVVNQLKKTGLAEDVYQLSTQEIENKLEELGISEELRKQVIAYHGTVRDLNEFERYTPTEQRYGQILSGTYFGEGFIAFSFAGGTPFTSPSGKVLKSSIDDSSFYTIDMQGTTPASDQGLINIIGQKEFDKILDLKEKGEIKGLRLENTREFLAGETKPTTQYVVYDNQLVETIQEFRQEQADVFQPKFQKQLEKKGIGLITAGFTYNEKYNPTKILDLMVEKGQIEKVC